MERKSLSRPKRSKPDKDISPTVKKALRLLATGAVTTQRAAAERCGITPEYLSRQLARPKVKAWIAEQARNRIDSALLRASDRMVELIDASSEHVSFDVSKHILAIGGIKPSEDARPLVNINMPVGYVIDWGDPRDERAPPVIDVTPRPDDAG